VFVDAEQATGLQHALGLAERSLLVAYRAEHERKDHGIGRCRFGGNIVCRSIKNSNFLAPGLGTAFSFMTKVGLGLKSKNPFNLFWVMGEIHSRPSTNLNHKALEACEQRPSVFALTRLHRLGQFGIETGEYWVMELAFCPSHGSLLLSLPAP